MWNVGLFVTVVGAVLMGLIAALEGNFTVGQQKRRGITDGLPVTRHFALWSDLFVLPFVVGIMWQYRAEWTWGEIGFMFMICSAGCGAMHIEWMRNATTQECLLSHDRLTWCGWVHVFYMMFVVTLVPLFYFFTPPAVNQNDHWVVGIPLIMHIFIATFLVGLMKKRETAPALRVIAITFFCIGGLLAAIIVRGMS